MDCRTLQTRNNETDLKQMRNEEQVDKRELTTVFAMYQQYVATAEKISDQRSGTNKWMLAVNSAVISFYGYLSAGKESVSLEEKDLWLVFVPACGAMVCSTWMFLISSYQKLNSAKFQVIKEIEARLPISPFCREEEIYNAMGRRPISYLEKFVPLVFFLFYLAILGIQGWLS